MSQIWARLDRVMVNAPFLDRFHNTLLFYLPRTSSDHCVTMVNERGNTLYGPIPLRFRRMWCDHHDFFTGG